MKALVTGGAGFIGSHLALELLNSGYEVVVLDDLSGGFLENVPKGAVFVEGSILDRPLLKSLFEEHHFDVVCHLAAYAAEGLSHFIKHFNYTNNLIGSVNLINLSVIHKVQRFLFTSSIAVYGDIPSPMKESDIPVPEDPYGVAKLAVEQELRVSCSQFGLPYTVFRPHNVYGEHQNIADRYRNVIGIFMNQLMRGESLSVFGDGMQTRAFTYVKDIVTPMAASLGRKECVGEVYNIGGDQPYTVRELAETVMTVMGCRSELNYLPPRNEVGHAHSDHSKLAALFPSKSTSLEEGLSIMAEWAKKHGPREPSRFGEIEIMKGLPPSWLPSKTD